MRGPASSPGKPTPAALATLIMFGALSGCLGQLAGTADGAAKAREAGLTVPFVPAELIPASLPVVAQVGFHEVVAPAAVDFPWADGDDAWPPRDFTLEFNGIQEALDEYGRPVPAYVFRFPDMVFVQDSVRLTGDGIDVDGHFEEHRFETHFDAADGHVIGSINFDRLSHGFAGPDYRTPLGHVPMYLMLLHLMQGDLRREVVIFEFDDSDGTHRKVWLHFEPFDEFRPMSGDCGVWEAETRTEPPYPEPLAPPPEEPPQLRLHSLLCVAPGELVPTWSWYGSQSEERYRLERTTPGFQLPPLQGEVLPGVVHATRSWDAVQGLVPLPLAGPTLVPPSNGEGDWADEVADRVAALYLSPVFLQYRAASETPFVDFISLGLPPGDSLQVLNRSLLPPEVGWDSEAFLDVSDGEQAHVGFVYTRDGSAERPDLHVAGPQGINHPAFFGSGLTAATVPQLPTSDDIAQQLHRIVPAEPYRVAFVIFYFEEVDSLHTNWHVLQPCIDTAPGGQTYIDALRGFAQFAQVFDPAQGPCDNDDIDSLRALEARPRTLPLRFGPLDSLNEPVDTWPRIPAMDGPGAYRAARPGAQPV